MIPHADDMAQRITQSIRDRRRLADEVLEEVAPDIGEAFRRLAALGENQFWIDFEVAKVIRLEIESLRLRHKFVFKYRRRCRNVLSDDLKARLCTKLRDLEYSAQLLRGPILVTVRGKVDSE